MAERIAEKYGYRNMGQVSPLLHQKLPLVCVSLFACFCQRSKEGHGMEVMIPSHSTQIIQGQASEV